MKWKLAPPQVCGLIILTVFGVALAARRAGLIQFLEFRVYDYFLRQAPYLPSGDPVVLVEIRESDIQSPDLDYPLTDNKLAELLEKMEEQQPAVIGLDIWRDIPVPKSGVELTNLNRVLLRYTNIIGIFTLGPPLSKEDTNAAVAAPISPPIALSQLGDADRIGFNDNFLVDDRVEKSIPKVRRTLLYTESPPGETADGEKVPPQRLDSFPFRVACMYLAGKGTRPGLNSVKAQTFPWGKAEISPFQPDDGPYVGADASGMQMLIDFKRPREFASYSVNDVLNGNVPPKSLRDKILLIGINASSVFDERVTPLRYGHPGVQVQALIVLQLLRLASTGLPSYDYATEWQEDAWMLVWCLFGGLIGFRVRSPWTFVGVIVAALALLGWIGARAFAAGYWVPTISPAVAFLPAAALVTSYVSYQELKNRNHLMQLFAHQVSPDIAQALWEQRDAFLAGDRPRSQELIATVLFTDLKGFSSTSEGMTAPELMEWLNEYMEVMATEVMAHDGVVEKYIGDAVMAVFGVPVPRLSPEGIAEDASNAVRCALAMGRGMEKLNAHWQERGLPVCSMRIGIHTGTLVAGSLGSSQRHEYTVIGDSVNTASRLESFEKDSTDPNLGHTSCRILISEATRLNLGEKFHLTPVGAINLKGKSEKVTVFRVWDELKSKPS